MKHKFEHNYIYLANKLIMTNLEFGKQMCDYESNNKYVLKDFNNIIIYL